MAKEQHEPTGANFVDLLPDDATLADIFGAYQAWLASLMPNVVLAEEGGGDVGDEYVTRDLGLLEEVAGLTGGVKFDEAIKPRFEALVAESIAKGNAALYGNLHLDRIGKLLNKGELAEVWKLVAEAVSGLGTLFRISDALEVMKTREAFKSSVVTKFVFRYMNMEGKLVCKDLVDEAMVRLEVSFNVQYEDRLYELYQKQGIQGISDYLDELPQRAARAGSMFKHRGRSNRARADLAMAFLEKGRVKQARKWYKSLDDWVTKICYFRHIVSNFDEANPTVVEELYVDLVKSLNLSLASEDEKSIEQLDENEPWELDTLPSKYWTSLHLGVMKYLIEHGFTKRSFTNVYRKLLFPSRASDEDVSVADFVEDTRLEEWQRWEIVEGIATNLWKLGDRQEAQARLDGWAADHPRDKVKIDELRFTLYMEAQELPAAAEALRKLVGLELSTYHDHYWNYSQACLEQGLVQDWRQLYGV